MRGGEVHEGREGGLGEVGGNVRQLSEWKWRARGVNVRGTRGGGSRVNKGRVTMKSKRR